MEESLKSLTVTVRGGGKLISHRPVFSKDGRTLYLIQSSSILAFSTSTCLLITRYTTPSSVPIANIQSRSESSLFVLTSDGRLFTLNTFSGRFELKVEIRIPSTWTPITNFINFMYPAGEENPFKHFLALGYPEDKSLPILYSVSVKNGTTSQLCWSVVPNQHSFDMSKDGRFVVAIQEKSIYCKDMNDPMDCRWHMAGTRKFTCVAVHPSQEFVCATGDDSGRILIWNNVMTQSPAKTVFHWHTLPVVDLIFSVEGSQMLSGGGECTLVKWDCSDTTNKRTLPRMGLPVRHLACSDEQVAVSHADNCVHLVDQYNKIVGVIKNFTNAYIPDEDQGGEKGDIFPAGITIDPSNNCLVMNSRPGWLQAYDFRRDKHIYSLDVCQQNYITAERDKLIPNADVIKVAFSKTGVWMATVDGRKYEKSYDELKLKFWKRNKESGNFVLSTVVDWPHEGNVSALEFRLVGEEGGDLVAMTSGDNRVKVWGLAERNTVHGDTEYWYLENVLEYKDLPAGPISISGDSSLAATAFGRIVALWDMEDLRLRLSLCHARLEEPLSMMQFGNKMLSHLLLCASAKSLYVWDIITSSLLWVVPVKVNCFSVDPHSGLCAAATSDHSVVFFEMSTPEPLVIHERVTKSGVLACNWVEDKGEELKSSLVFLNNSQELCAMRQKRDDDEQEVMKIGQDVHMTVFSEMVAEKLVSGVESGKGLGQGNVGQKAYALLREIMDSSPHSMPSMSYYCTQLMRSVSTPAPVKEQDRLNKIEALMKKKKKSKKDGRSYPKESEYLMNNDAESVSVKSSPDNEKQSHIDALLEQLNLDDLIEDDTTWVESIFKDVAVD